MLPVTEICDSFPLSDEARTFTREEATMYEAPKLGPIKIFEHEPLAKVHFPVVYEGGKFAAPPKASTNAITYELPAAVLPP